MNYQENLRKTDPSSHSKNNGQASGMSNQRHPHTKSVVYQVQSKNSSKMGVSIAYKKEYDQDMLSY